jgi:tetratricopeptide (TPR) repeat protein
MTKVARIQAEDGANARVRGPRVGLDPPVWRPSAQYYAFLSYSHKDEELADWLHSQLERFQVPRSLAGKLTANGVIPKRLTPIFRDRHELAAATDLGEEIQAALAASQYLLVLCSPDAAKSHWTNAEIETFKRSRPDGCVLAAIVAGDPFASDIKGHEGEECFPPALRQKYDRRGRATGKRAEPLAADLRETGDGRRMGFLKLVAGMLGVGLDELVQRDATRRQRRLAWLAAASLGGMAVTSTLAVFAIQSRDEARDQRREAEGLVAFMLGDLKDKLEPIGRLDTLDGVGARVLAYYSKQDASELADKGLMQRSRALSLTAQVAYLRGNFDTAEKLYREAMAGTAEAVSREPEDAQRIFDHAQNVFYVGSIAADRGDLGQAERSFREYRKLAERMTTLQPDNLKWKMEVQYAEANLGVVLLRQRRYEDSVRQFDAALRTIEAVAAIEPENPEYQKSRVESLAWLADAQLANGDLGSATKARSRQVDLLHALAKRSGDVAYQQKLIPAAQTLGRLLAVGGQRTEAENQLGAAVTIAERLLPSEPDNSKWIEFAATAHLALAQQHQTNDDWPEAKVQTAKGCRYAGRLQRPAGASAWQLVHWSCIDRQAHLALADGQFSRAASLAQQSADLARGLKSGDSVSDRILVAKSLLLVGDAFRAMNMTDRARQNWAQALRLMRSGNEQPWERAVRADLLERTGQVMASRQIKTELAARGFRNVDMLKT